MVSKKLLSLVLIALILTFASASEATLLRDEFLSALEKNDQAVMNSVIEKHKGSVPDEVRALIKEAEDPNAAAEDRNSKLYVAELMAVSYKDASGDASLVKEVKKKSFDLKLPAPVRPEPVDGAYVVEFPKATEHEKNVFKPGSIVIKKGGTVKWVNRDEIAHVFSSMPLIGMGGIFSPSVEPNQSWSYKFEKPGEYYYICFIHRGMIGKVTVEE